MNSYLWDTHAHLYSEYFSDIKSVIANASVNNVKKIINASVDKETMIEVINLSKKNCCVYACLGIHPENVDKYKEEDICFIEENLSLPFVLAIGEIGLDYHYENYDKEKQIELFRKQLLLAEKNNIPVVIHSRDATKDTIDILKEYNVRGVIHSFSGSLESAKEYIKMGFSLGVNGVVTFKNCKMIEVYKQIDLRHLVLETDCPYLSPMPLRGKVNEPANVMHIVKFLSDNLDVTSEYITNITTENTLRIFDKIQ